MKTELGRRKIKNVEDSGKSFVVFSTNFCLEVYGWSIMLFSRVGNDKGDQIFI